MVFVTVVVFVAVEVVVFVLVDVLVVVLVEVLDVLVVVVVVCPIGGPRTVKLLSAGIMQTCSSRGIETKPFVYH